MFIKAWEAVSPPLVFLWWGRVNGLLGQAGWCHVWAALHLRQWSVWPLCWNRNATNDRVYRFCPLSFAWSECHVTLQQHGPHSFSYNRDWLCHWLYRPLLWQKIWPIQKELYGWLIGCCWLLSLFWLWGRSLIGFCVFLLLNASLSVEWERERVWQKLAEGKTIKIYCMKIF